MTERKPCIRCERAIDGWAKICPFCNWDQTLPAPAQEPPKPAAVTAYKPADEFNLKKKLYMVAGGVVILIIAFFAGMVINKDDAPKTAPETIEEQMAEGQTAKTYTPLRRADTPLVPMNEPGGIEQPVTSAPVAAQPGTTTNDYQRTDATAVSATEYAELAKRAHAEKEKMAVLVDPRSLTGPAYAQVGDHVPVRRPVPPAAAPMPGQMAAQTQQPVPQQQTTQPPMTSAGGPATPPPAMQPRRASLRTRPVPEYQPLPQISAHGSARLSLTIGPDGRVQEVAIERPLQGGNTAALLRAVQRWRFKPATENGEPVTAPYSVEISFGR